MPSASGRADAPFEVGAVDSLSVACPTSRRVS